jgi:hypothetical protein
MKSLSIIPLILLFAFGVAGGALEAAGVRVNLCAPIVAAGIGSVAGIMGLIPIRHSASGDAAGIVQSALYGTVIHLLLFFALTSILLLTHVIPTTIASVAWVLSAYWISLVILLMQLRRVMVTSLGAAKVQQ